MNQAIAHELKNKLISKSATIGIVGLGYVGLPLMLRYIAVGFSVIGFDIDTFKIDKLKRGESYIEHISSSSINNAINFGFFPTADFSNITQCDALILCVPTPLSKFREPDLSHVLDTMDAMLPYLVKGQVLSLESTTYPGTTDEELLPRIESMGFKVGEDFFLIYSPEREDPGNNLFSTQTIPKICGGYTSECTAVGVALYEAVIDKVVSVSSTKTAEMTKLLENIHRSVNIGLVNEMKVVADKMGIDIHEVIRAAATKPFGFTAYYPGPGLGGHCIPIDPFYLTWKAREYGVHTRFIELAGEVNSSMPHWVIEKLVNALNDLGLSVKGSRILLLGIAYKKNVDDMRESPSVKLMEILQSKGAILEYSDPHVPVFPKMKEHTFDLTSIALTSKSIKSFDVVLLATDHDKFNYDLILSNAKLIIDTRGRFQHNISTNVINA